MNLTIKLFVLGLAASIIGCADDLPDLNEDASSMEASSVSTTTGEIVNIVSVLAPSMNEFYWSYGGPIAGKFCVLWNEPSDPATWDDNFLCSDRDFGLTWHYGTPAASSATCTQILEESDPHTWQDNFLCSPQNYGFRWSNAGPVAGMNCLIINEPAEEVAHTWEDNFLCLPQ